jgi:hypothetical protein
MPVSTTRTSRHPAARFLLLAGLALCWSAGGASAQTADTLGGRLPVASDMECYSRTFDKGHMAAHPKQRITSIALAISSTQASGELRLWPYVMMVRMKGEKAGLWQTETCEFDEAGAFRCIVACDGGHFTLSAPETGSGLRLELSENYTLQGGCGDSRKPVVLSARTEEPAYALEAKDMKVCRSQFRDSRKASEVLREIGRNR